MRSVEKSKFIDNSGNLSTKETSEGHDWDCNTPNQLRCTSQFPRAGDCEAIVDVVIVRSTTRGSPFSCSGLVGG